MARKPRITLTYTRKGETEGTDITDDLSDYLTGVTYTDKPGGASPDIDIDIEDANKIWIDQWFPSSQDSFTLTMFYEGEDTELNTGKFEIDDISTSCSGRGDAHRIGCQATPLSKSLREERSKEYEDVTLAAIAQEIATRQELTLTGEIVDVTFERLTQNEEDDLTFLQRISEEYGQLFKIEDTSLIFYNWADIEAQEPQFTLSREPGTEQQFIPISFRGRRRNTGVYNSAELSYKKADDEEEIKVIIPAEPTNDSADVLKLSEQSESQAQAELKAKEKLRAANAKEWQGSLEMEGEPYYRSGITFALTGFGQYDGKWLTEDVRHSFTRNGGWKADLKIRRVSAAD